MQQCAGSGPIANITSDVPIDYVDMIDQHHYTSKSQKSLSAGAAMIVRLGVALLVANPFAGGGLSSTMAGAGFDTLCSEAAVNMIENDGNPGRALQAMREKNIVKTVARSVAAAGLTGALGTGTAPTSVESFAKEFLARSAVHTTMAIAFDGVKPGEAIRQGALNAAVQTVGACIANKIGDMADSKMGTEQIGDITQEIFHGFLGAGIGAGTAAIMGQDIDKGATSGAISAVVGHSTAKISGSKALGDLVAVAVAMMTDQDVGIAYMTSNNATTYNYAAHQSKATPEAKGDEKEDEEEKSKVKRSANSTDADQECETINSQAQTEAKKSFLAGLEEGEEKSSNWTRPPTPPIEDTWGETNVVPWVQTNVISPVKKMIPGVVKDAAHQAGEWVADQHAKAIRDNENLKTGNIEIERNLPFKIKFAKAVRLVSFEALDLAGAGYEYAKAYVRRGLRAGGVPAGVAQDIVSAGDGLLMVTGAGGAAKTGVTVGKSTVKSIGNALKPTPKYGILSEATLLRVPANTNFGHGLGANRSIMPVAKNLSATGTYGYSSLTLDDLAVRYGATATTAGETGLKSMMSSASGGGGSGTFMKGDALASTTSSASEFTAHASSSNQRTFIRSVPKALEMEYVSSLTKFSQARASNKIGALSSTGSGRQVVGTAHMTTPLVDVPVVLRGTHGNAGNIPLDVAKMMEGKIFNNFDQFRKEFWTCMSRSKYADEFRPADLARMNKGNAPITVLEQSIGKRVTYELHHKTPISQGGAVYDLSNIQIVTPRFHMEVLEKIMHFGGK